MKAQKYDLSYFLVESGFLHSEDSVSKLIESGSIKVNGEIVKDLPFVVEDSINDKCEIEVKGKIIRGIQGRAKKMASVMGLPRLIPYF